MLLAARFHERRASRKIADQQIVEIPGKLATRGQFRRKPKRVEEQTHSPQSTRRKRTSTRPRQTPEIRFARIGGVASAELNYAVPPRPNRALHARRILRRTTHVGYSRGYLRPAVSVVLFLARRLRQRTIACYAPRGIRSVASSPPRSRLRRRTEPPCAWAMLRAIERPRPLPPVLRLREPSTR